MAQNEKGVLGIFEVRLSVHACPTVKLPLVPPLIVSDAVAAGLTTRVALLEALPPGPVQVRV